MTAILDTSVLVRYLMLDPPSQGATAQALLDSPERFLVTGVTIVETAFVLMRLYGVARAVVVDLLVGLVSRSNVDVLDISTARVVEALLLCRPSARVSFADALIWAAARETQPDALYTFDRRFPSLGINRRVLV
jgi:predicted nucleic acid-binding protein